MSAAGSLLLMLLWMEMSSVLAAAAEETSGLGAALKEEPQAMVRSVSLGVICI